MKQIFKTRAKITPFRTAKYPINSTREYSLYNSESAAKRWALSYKTGFMVVGASFYLSYHAGWLPHNLRIVIYFERFARFITSVLVASWIIIDYKLSVGYFRTRKLISQSFEKLSQSMQAILLQYGDRARNTIVSSVVEKLSSYLTNNAKNRAELNYENLEQDTWNRCHTRSAKLLRSLALNHGGLYVKCGQSLTMMNHILPPQYYEILEGLQDDVRHSPFSVIKGILESEFGCEIDRIFYEFDEIPIAAASIAQVHRATLRSENGKRGAEVAVKVQHDDVSRNFEHDFRTIQSLCVIAGSLFAGFNLSELLEQSKEILRAELDFIKEAENTERCAADLLKYDPSKKIIAPQVFHALTTSRILVTEFIRGHKITEMHKIPGACSKEIAQQYIDIFCHQMFCTGFVHADPHPGNILIRAHPDSEKWRFWPFRRKPVVQLILIDHGLYTELQPIEKALLCNLWLALSTRRDSTLKKLLHDAFGITDQAVFGRVFLMRPYEVNQENEKKTSIFSVFARVREYQQLMRIDRSEYQRWILDNMERTTKMLLQLPPSFVLVLRNINTVRGVHQELGSPVNRIARMTISSFRNQPRRETAAVDSLLMIARRKIEYNAELVWISLNTMWHEWCFRLTIYFLRFVLSEQEYAELQSYPIIG